MLFCCDYTSPLGQLTLASDGENLVGLWMEGQKYFGGSLREELCQKEDVPGLVAGKQWLNRYFAGEKPKPGEILLAPMGSPFRQAVWRILCGIPYGECVTYGDIAREVAACTGKAGMSGQAVGGAVGHNPISIIIPCHRVVGAGGSLTGYAGGIQKKVWLLTHEGAEMSRFFVPTKGTAL